MDGLVMIDPVEMTPEEMAAHEELMAQEHERRMGLLNALAMAILPKRQDAIDHRAASGIEDDWIGDEEFYQGIDDANRHEHNQAATKPLAGSGSQTTGIKEQRYGSTVFPNLTAPYVDAAAARISDMLLPTDERNFAIQPTPIPDLIGAVEEIAKAVPNQPQDGSVALPNGQAMTMPQLADKMAKVKEEAQRKSDKAQDVIDDWLTECDWNGEMRRMIDDCAKLGSGVVKGPFPVVRKAKAWKTENGAQTLEIKQEIKPASKAISCWDLFPDPNCGDDIHRGDFIWERDRLSASKLRELGADAESGYLPDQIELVIQQGPVRHTAAGKVQAKNQDFKDLFEVWYYVGIVTAEQMEAAGCPCPDEVNEVHALLTIVNDSVIRASLNPLGGGDFPYDVIPWKRRAGMPWGTGVARQGRTAQRMVVAGARNLMNNAGMAGGPQVIFRKGGLIPLDGKWEIRPLKFWQAEDDQQDVSRAFTFVAAPMMIEELQSIIQMGQKFFEDVTGLPMLLQGQQGNAPDTVGGMTMLNNNATSVLRRIARLFDSFTEAHIGRYYAYLMEHHEDQEVKGDYVIDARGSSALVERDIQNQEMIQVLQLSMNPAYGWSPKKAGEEYLKSRRFDPQQFKMDEEEAQALAQQPPPVAPAVEAAQIRAASAEKIKQIDAEVRLAMDKSDTDRDLVYSNAELERVQNEHQARMAELSVKRELALLDYANRTQTTLDQVKAKLAQVAMTLRTQKELAQMNGQAKQVARPAVEPKGRAPNGRAFEK